MRPSSSLVALASVALFACSSSSGGDDTTEQDASDQESSIDDAGLDASTRDSALVGDSTATDGTTSKDTGTSPSDATGDSTPPKTDAALDPGPGPTAKCTFTKDADGFFQLTSPKSDYWVRLPPSYDVASPTPQPLLVAIHGCGDTAKNFATWAAAPYATRATQSYIGISLGGREGGCWTMDTDGEIVMAAIAHVRSCFYVHQKKIFLGGYSSGGMLTYYVGLKNAAMFAGLLIEHSGVSQAVGASNVDSVLKAAAWKINIAHTAHTEDESFPIAGVRSDRDKIKAAGFPMDYVESPGTHDGTSDDWAGFLNPHMAGWHAP